MYIVIHLCQEINIHSSSGRRLEGLFLDAAFICFPWLDLFWIIYMWKLLTVTISAFSETWLPLVNYKPDGGFCNLLHLPLMLGQGNLVWTLTLQLVRLINHPVFFFLKSKLLHSLGWSLSHNPSSASQVLRWPLCSTMPSKINKSGDLVVVFSQTNLLSSKISLQPFPLYNKILFKINFHLILFQVL